MVSLICLGPSFQKMTHHFLLHGSLWPTNLEKNLKPCTISIFSCADLPVLQGKFAKYKKYMGHSAHVTNIRFSSGDKKLVTTGGADTALMVFDHIVPAGRITQCGDSDDSDIDSEEEGGK